MRIALRPCVCVFCCLHRKQPRYEKATYKFLLVFVAHRDVAGRLSAVVAANDALERRLGPSLLPIRETLLRHLNRLVGVAQRVRDPRVVRLTEAVLVAGVDAAVLERHLVEFLKVAGRGLANTRVFMQLPIRRN